MNAVQANFFFRDFVSEDVISVSVGMVWLYFFKETLIGVRHTKKKVAWFVRLESTKPMSSTLVPTIEFLTEEHIRDAVNEVDKTDEKTEFVDFEDMLSKAAELVANEMSEFIDTHLVG